ncbi:alpha/beta fold hydrolase [Teredinibacter purpureus]|uniref:hypothetical protein n=1 Tax=Teredinibacter purpureus TaxID=2731756 RepID=UPI0005F77981|nr:hypothetical protein [Teredinibacter purpureus]
MKNGLKIGLIAVVVIAISSLSACISPERYRTDYSVCSSANPQEECQTNAIQKSIDSSGGNEDYTLGFIEFDDQGQLWDRAQMDSVLTQVAIDAADQDVLAVVFVHGWKHSAKANDDNITNFRGTLRNLSAMESAISAASNIPARKVVGIYLGWRGGSIKMPVVEELSFWNRKETAHKVGYGGTTEVLARLDELRRTKRAMAKLDNKNSNTRLVVIGHSFGGAVVYSALSEILEYGFIHTEGPDAIASDTIGFADLVVLINPAFEAQRYANLAEMSTERGSYFPGQLPVLAILTSESDLATKVAFPAGRWFSTMFEREREVERFNPVLQQPYVIDQGKANVTAVGHFDIFRTHYLSSETARSMDAETIEQQWKFNLDDEVKLFLAASDSWENDHPSSVIPFKGSTLTRTEDSAGRNPYLNIRVDEHLIPNHNDIYDPRIESFIQQLIMISSQRGPLDERRSLRPDAPAE